MRAVFLEERIREAENEDNLSIIAVEMYSVLALGVLDRWVPKGKLAGLLVELVRRDVRVRRAVWPASSYEEFLDIISAPLYLAEAFEYGRRGIRLSELGEAVFNEVLAGMPPERFYELKREIVEAWKKVGGG